MHFAKTPSSRGVVVLSPSYVESRIFRGTQPPTSEMMVLPLPTRLSNACYDHWFVRWTLKEASVARTILLMVPLCKKWMQTIMKSIFLKMY